ncbi:MAG: helix-turn-helix domain-containing protein [bacterium]|nr:helix-turn-helix domain-containing protein [bacterium]
MSGRLEAALKATINNAGGITLREAAKSSGISFNTLSRMRRGDYAPHSVVVFLKACEWAGVDPFKALAAEPKEKTDG